MYVLKLIGVGEIGTDKIEETDKTKLLIPKPSSRNDFLSIH